MRCAFSRARAICRSHSSTAAGATGGQRRLLEVGALEEIHDQIGGAIELGSHVGVDDSPTCSLLILPMPSPPFEALDGIAGRPVMGGHDLSASCSTVGCARRNNDAHRSLPMYPRGRYWPRSAPATPQFGRVIGSTMLEWSNLQSTD